LQAVLAPFRASDASFLIPGGSEPIAEDDTIDISHEALIREWAQLKAWTQANRDALRRLEHIKGRMRQWEEQGRDKTLLLPPGLPLEEGKKLLAEHGGVLIEDVQSYIVASLKRDRQRIWRRRGLIMAIFSVVVLYQSYSGWIEKQPWGYLRDIHSGWSYELKGGLPSLGRKTSYISPDVHIDNRYILRVHLLISRSNYIAVDAQSTNGTTVNAEFLTRGSFKALKDGDLIALANSALLQFSANNPSFLDFLWPRISDMNSTSPRG
jgi:hypothetical protein